MNVEAVADMFPGDDNQNIPVESRIEFFVRDGEEWQDAKTEH
jgi:hypothetical protein